MDLNEAAQCLEALGSTPRLSIYRLLVEAGPDGLVVGDIQTELDMPGSTLSHHLSKLVKTSLVRQERESRMLICKVNIEHMQSVMSFMLENCCRGSGCS